MCCGRPNLNVKIWKQIKCYCIYLKSLRSLLNCKEAIKHYSTRNVFQVAHMLAASLRCAFLASVVCLMINGEPHVDTLSLRKQSLCIISM